MSCSNTFNHFGEGLFGVFNEEGILVANGGLNKRPFSNGQFFYRIYMWESLSKFKSLYGVE